MLNKLLLNLVLPYPILLDFSKPVVFPPSVLGAVILKLQYVKIHKLEGSYLRHLLSPKKNHITALFIKTTKTLWKTLENVRFLIDSPNVFHSALFILTTS